MRWNAPTIAVWINPGRRKSRARRVNQSAEFMTVQGWVWIMNGLCGP